jgi:hypothetical protein
MSHAADVNGHTVGQRIGYTRVSTVAQTLDQQNDALAKASVTKTFSDTMSGVLESLAEYERELTIERTALKRAASRAIGTKFGRPRKVNDAEDIATAKRMNADGHTGRAIADTSGSAGQRFIATSPSDRWRKPTRSRLTPRTFVLCREAHRYRRRHPRTPLTLFLSWAQTIGVLLAGPAVVARTHHRSRLLAGARTYSPMSAGVISCRSCDRWSKKCRSRSASATGTSNSAPT